MNQGKISEVGTYDELLKNKADFFSLINDYSTKNQCEEEKATFDINEGSLN